MRIFEYPKKKLIVACAAILIAILVPSYMALNGIGGNGPEDGRADGGAVAEAAYPTDLIIEEIVEPNPELPLSAPVVLAQAATFAVLPPTTTAAPTEPPIWVPEDPATDGNVLASGLVEKDSVNVLIMGLDKEAFLLDTIGIASVSKESKSIKLIMFPRDTYVGYSDAVGEQIAKIGHAKLPGIYKLNNAYNIGDHIGAVSDTEYNRGKFGEQGFDFLAQVIYEKFGVEIDDYVRINLYGFVKLVDMFGGVRVNVPVRMNYYDPLQNLRIDLSKGSHTLNGAQAEGFVRFRQGYDSAGNLSVTADRTKNQIAFLKAFYEQHAKLSNIGKIPDLLSLLKKNVVHSVSAEELLTKYADLLTDVVDSSYTLESHEFATSDKRINGSAYLVIEPPPTEEAPSEEPGRDGGSGQDARQVGGAPAPTTRVPMPLLRAR
ncbi:MAG: LCP family protein [Clostridiales bacterium]|jgi:LCP family protein required for cell wall assembly|nr:LCP family protein [Clostridiales bacterium]